MAEESAASVVAETSAVNPSLPRTWLAEVLAGPRLGRNALLASPVAIVRQWATETVPTEEVGRGSR